MVREIPYRRELACLALSGLMLAARTAAAQSEKEAAKPAEPEDRPVLVLDFKPATPADDATAKLVTAAFAQSIKQAGLHLKAAEKAGVPATLAACEDDHCVADAVKSLPFDYVFSGRIGSVGDKKLVFVSLVDPKTGFVKGRASGTLAGTKTEYATELKPIVTALFDHADQDATGEVLAHLSEMRVSVLVDEYDTDDKAVDPETLEPCLRRHFNDAMVRLVSPADDVRINRMVDPKLLLQTGVPELLTNESVDLLVAGVVKYTSGPEMEGFVSATADLSLELLRVDTGEVLVDSSLHGRGPGGNTLIANHAAALQLCGQANEAIKQALSKRMDRGRRVTVHISGHIGSDVGQDIADEIKKLPRVVGVRLKNVGDESGMLDVAISGGNGVLLALELAHSGSALKISEAAPGMVKIVKE